MHSTYNEGKSVVAERFVRALKSKIFKHMTAVFFYYLDHHINNYNSTYHRTIKMKPIDVKADSYPENNVDSKEKGPKFQVDDHVRILNYKNTFAKVYTLNWLDEDFVIRKTKNTVPWTYVVNNLNGAKLVELFIKIVKEDY